MDWRMSSVIKTFPDLISTASTHARKGNKLKTCTVAVSHAKISGEKGKRQADGSFKPGDWAILLASRVFVQFSGGSEPLRLRAPPATHHSWEIYSPLSGGSETLLYCLRAPPLTHRSCSSGGQSSISLEYQTQPPPILTRLIL